MIKEKLKLVLDLYKDGKIDFEQALILLEEHNIKPMNEPLNMGGYLPSIPRYAIL